ncbi:WhiB family transcriptional regulator [Nocardioides sp. R1-1]|uniref:WhiB family transcriptional regulator n=1 Tax=Nocardioides sp. R1-1 TaxID=3383502 RepID=UPI0038D1C215
MDLPKYDPLHWQNDARCFQLRVSPDVMQPEKPTRAEVEEAKQVCHGCPVLEQCRQHAVDQDGAYGIHAGEWFGPDPVWFVERSCPSCGATSRVRQRYGSSGEWFCSRACRSHHARTTVPA